jgi:hypothetical protein
MATVTAQLKLDAQTMKQMQTIAASTSNGSLTLYVLVTATEDTLPQPAL